MPDLQTFAFVLVEGIAAGSVDEKYHLRTNKTS